MTIPFLLEAKRIFSNRCVWDELGYFHQNHPYATIPFFTFPLRESEEKAYFRCGGPWLFSKKKKKKKFQDFQKPLHIAWLQILLYRGMFEVYLFEIGLSFSTVILILCNFSWLKIIEKICKLLFWRCCHHSKCYIEARWKQTSDRYFKGFEEIWVSKSILLLIRCILYITI